MFAAKTRGADHLATAVAGLDLQAFVLFSSVSSVLGSVGQGAYAAANGYLNGLAVRLRAEGIPTTSIAWGPWEPELRGGMAADPAARAAAARLGVRALTDAEAGPMLAAALNADCAQTVAVAVDVAAYLTALGGHTRAALLADLPAARDRVPMTAETVGIAAPSPGWLRAEFLAAEEPHERLRAGVRSLVERALGAVGTIDEARGFADLGLDSIMAIDLRAGLSQALGVDLPATVAFDHPTVVALADFAAEYLPTPTPAHPAPEPEAMRPPQLALDLVDVTSCSLEELIQAVHQDLELEK